MDSHKQKEASTSRGCQFEKSDFSPTPFSLLPSPHHYYSALLRSQVARGVRQNAMPCAFLCVLWLVAVLVHGGGGGRGGGAGSRAANKEDKGLSLTRARILSELRDLSLSGILLDVPFNSSREECGIRLSPMSNNLLEWHFSFTGVEDSAYAGGVYHGRIRLHPEYPRKAPSISMLTPTGRWQVGKEICLSASAYHQETWDMNWTLRTLVMSLRGFITTQPREIGGILTTVEEQRRLAAASRSWVCPVCKVKHGLLVGEEATEAKLNSRPRLILSSNCFLPAAEPIINPVDSADLPPLPRRKKAKHKPKRLQQLQGREKQPQQEQQQLQDRQSRRVEFNFGLFRASVKLSTLVFSLWVAMIVCFNRVMGAA